jgi:hypothetical protein
MSIFDVLFGSKPTPPVVRKPTCDDCERYRKSIKDADDSGDKDLAERLRAAFYTHCAIRHTRRDV